MTDLKKKNEAANKFDKKWKSILYRSSELSRRSKTAGIKVLEAKTEAGTLAFQNGQLGLHLTSKKNSNYKLKLSNYQFLKVQICKLSILATSADKIFVHLGFARK